MGECQFLNRQFDSAHCPVGKLNKHEVPGGDSPKDIFVSPDGPLYFRLAINTFERNLSVKGYFSEKKSNTKKP